MRQSSPRPVCLRPYAPAVREQRLGANGDIDWEAAYSGDVPDTPVDRDVVRIARELSPGSALDMGCGSGQNSIWLARQGWRVHGVDMTEGQLQVARATRDWHADRFGHDAPRGAARASTPRRRRHGIHG